MFERYTDRSRRAVVLAQEYARDLKHNYIGTEHLLLGLLGEGEGVAALVLKDLGYTFDTAREDVVRIIGEGQTAPTGHIPFTPRLKKVLELGLREALQLGYAYIGTEHQLLGLVREGEGVAAQILQQSHELDVVRGAVLTRLDAYAKQAKQEAAKGVPEPEIPPSPDDPTFRVWWHFLRPDRLMIADDIDLTARDYERQKAHETAAALRHVARCLRASAAAFGNSTGSTDDADA